MVERVLVFGTFDGLHEGHLFFLQSARLYGKKLIVAVARDEHVKFLKKKVPKFSQVERLAAIRKRKEVAEAVLSDAKLGSFDVIYHTAPNQLILGHDQWELETALKQWMETSSLQIPIKRLSKKK